MMVIFHVELVLDCDITKFVHEIQVGGNSLAKMDNATAGGNSNATAGGNSNCMAHIATYYSVSIVALLRKLEGGKSICAINNMSHLVSRDL